LDFQQSFLSHEGTSKGKSYTLCKARKSLNFGDCLSPAISYSRNINPALAKPLNFLCSIESWWLYKRRRERPEETQVQVTAPHPSPHCILSHLETLLARRPVPAAAW
jgi:hypothetical protein